MGRKPSLDKADRLALRINARDKFALELLAQKKGTTVTALVMEFIRKPLEKELTVTRNLNGNEETLYIPDEVYDPLLPDRTVKLAQVAPELLSDNEKVIWKVIQENPAYMLDGVPRLKAIRERWESIKSYADELLGKHSG